MRKAILMLSPIAVLIVSFALSAQTDEAPSFLKEFRKWAHVKSVSAGPQSHRSPQKSRRNSFKTSRLQGKQFSFSRMTCRRSHRSREAQNAQEIHHPHLGLPWDSDHDDEIPTNPPTP